MSHTHFQHERNGENTTPLARRNKTIILLVTILLLFPIGYFIYSHNQAEKEEKSITAEHKEAERIAKEGAERKTEDEAEAAITPLQISDSSTTTDSTYSDSTHTASGEIGSVEEFIQVVKTADAAVTEIVPILKGINSKQSADASVPRLEKAYEKFSAALKKIENSNLQMSSFANCSDSEEDEMDLVMSRFEANTEIFMRQGIRIEEKDFYGSQSLERFFDTMDADSNNDSPTASGKNSEAEEFIQIFKEADSAFTEMINILKSINSKRSADASVPRLDRAYKRMDEAIKKIEGSNIQLSSIVNSSEAEEDEMDLILSRLDACKEILMRQLFRLAERNFYGSRKLERWFDNIE